MSLTPKRADESATEMVQVDVFSEEALTGDRRLTSRAFLTFVAIDEAGGRVPVPPLVIETEAQAEVARDAQARREQRLKRKAAAKLPSA